MGVSNPSYIVYIIYDVIKDSHSASLHRYPSDKSSKLDLHSLNHSSPAKYNPITAYGASKLCNLLFAMEFSRRYVEKGVACNAVHPGNLLPTGLSKGAGLFYRAAFAMARPFTKSVVSGVA
jgi:WW domain-containing oxidoreductase